MTRGPSHRTISAIGRSFLAHTQWRTMLGGLRSPEIMVDRLGELGKQNLPKGAGSRGAGYATLHVCICQICINRVDINY